MTKRILVIEDNVNEICTFERVARHVKGVVIDIATCFESALRLLNDNNYDAVVLDVFFPTKEGGPALSYMNSIKVAKILESRNIPYCFNTSGNHHGKKYRKFLPEKFQLRDKGYFGQSGYMLEAYPTDAEGDLNKQSETAVQYLLLVLELKEHPEQLAVLLNLRWVDFFEGTEVGFGGAPYGDYDTTRNKFNDARKISPFLHELFTRHNI